MSVTLEGFKRAVVCQVFTELCTQPFLKMFYRHLSVPKHNLVLSSNTAMLKIESCSFREDGEEEEIEKEEVL